MKPMIFEILSFVNIICDFLKKFIFKSNTLIGAKPSHVLHKRSIKW